MEGIQAKSQQLYIFFFLSVFSNNMDTNSKVQVCFI